jgi:hypothetical protein
MAGRPTKLTQETIDKICLAIRAGNYAKIAAQMAGIGESTYYEWLSIAKEPDCDVLFTELAESIQRAEADAEVAAVALIRQAANNGSWQAAGWLLERKNGERWGRNDKLRQEITGTNGEPISVSIDDMRASVLAFLNEGKKNGSITSGTDTDSTS